MTVLFSEDFNAFDASGFAPTPAAGQLDSDLFMVKGLSDGDLMFGGTETSGDFARGVTTGGVSSGGIYAFNLGANDFALGFQATGSDVTPGAITLQITNTSGAAASDFSLSYDVIEFNDQGRANSLNASFSEDGVTFTPITGATFTSTEAADSTPSFLTTTFSSLSFSTASPIAAGASLFIQFFTDDVSGGGSRDELGVDNIVVETVSTAPTGPSLVINEINAVPIRIAIRGDRKSVV